MDLMNLFTNPMWLLYALAFPTVLVLMLGFLASGSFGGSVTSYDYYGVTMMLFCIMNAATYSANSFLEERIKKPNMRIIFSPVHPGFIHFSKVLATFIFCAVTYGAVGIALSLLLGVNYGGSASWAILLILLLTLLFCSALGVLVCCLLKSESSANQIISMVVAIMAVLGGLFFPVEGLGFALSAISWLSPAKWVFSACLQVIYDGNFTLFWPVCGILGLLTIGAVLASSLIFKGEEYL
jgi:ABC-2 type transport system permease protein